MYFKQIQNLQIRSIEVINFDVSPNPVMDKATSSESIGNQMSETVVPSSDQIVTVG